MFAKYWEAGKVKTRLARTIGEAASRDVHLLFVKFLLKKFAAVGDFRTLVASPADQKLEFEEILPDTWQLDFQCDGDLGARMSHFFRTSQCDGQINILIGSDTPNLPVRFVEQCVDLLDRHQLVLGPSADGGYYLIAMRKHLPEVFEGVQWSSRQVLSQTLEIANRNSISYGLLPQLNDVDEIQDLKQLVGDLRRTNENPDDQQLLNDLTAMELNIG